MNKSIWVEDVFVPSFIGTGLLCWTVSFSSMNVSLLFWISLSLLLVFMFWSFAVIVSVLLLSSGKKKDSSYHTNSIKNMPINYVVDEG